MTNREREYLNLLELATYRIPRPIRVEFLRKYPYVAGLLNMCEICGHDNDFCAHDRSDWLGPKESTNV